MKQTGSQVKQIGRVTGSVLLPQLDDLGQRAAGLLEPQFMHLKNRCDYSASPRVSGGIMARAQEVAILNILSVIINSAHGEGESGPQGRPHYHGFITELQGLGTCAEGLLESRTAEGKCCLAFLTSVNLPRPTQLRGNRGQAFLLCSPLSPGQLPPLSPRLSPCPQQLTGPTL